MNESLIFELFQDIFKLMPNPLERPVVSGVKRLDKPLQRALAAEKVFIQEIPAGKKIEPWSAVVVEKKSEFFAANLNALVQTVYLIRSHMSAPSDGLLRPVLIQQCNGARPSAGRTS
jgi:hypothetical protein